MNPLVSVVCLCYNHKRYLREAIESVINQTYKNLQLILVDDASTDDSQGELQKIAEANPNIELILLPTNLGNCKAFNVGWRKSKGDFIIDFATDDVMLPNHIQNLFSFFQTLDDSYGVVFTDATYIDESGKPFRKHFDYLLGKKLIQSIPQGDVFRKVLTRYFIPGQTTMVRKKVMDELNGYDENLSYEDFDFWVRSSRNYKYAFLNENQMLIRKLKTSMSAHLKTQLHSTYLVCRKAQTLCKDEDDLNALRQRVLYEFRLAVFHGNKAVAKLLSAFLVEIKYSNFQYYLLKMASIFI